MIEVQNLSRYYGQHRAVDSVSFRIESNSIVGFLGLNGAGKTTTLKVIAGLLPPSAGTVTIDGVDMATAPESFRKRIGFLPETPPLYTEMTVVEFLRYVGRLRGMPVSELEQRIPDVVQRCQLSGREDWVIDTLSHGYRKRVGIAQAIVHKPRLVILDEPISGLDPVQIVEMRKVIKGLAAESTVLVSSHILSEIAATCDRVLVLQKGKLQFIGSEQDLADRRKGAVRLGLSLRAAAAAVKAALEPLETVVAVRIDDEAAEVLEVELDLSSDSREAVVAALVGAGVGVRRVEDALDELEETFMDLTRDPGASAAGGDA
jgi:ABC-2 type transport system ATP-binding protein